MSEVVDQHFADEQPFATPHSPYNTFLNTYNWLATRLKFDFYTSTFWGKYYAVEYEIIKK